MKRLAIITTHPIQYNAPLFKLLTQRKKVEIKVFYTWGETVLKDKYDPGFKKIINWDIPLLEGYHYTFLNNTAKKKGSHHFTGIINPDIIQTLKKWEPDCILVFGWNYQSHLKVLRYFKNKLPVLFRGDSTIIDEKKNLKSYLRMIILKYVYSNIDFALYTGTNNKLYFKKAGLKDYQLNFAPHAVENNQFLNDQNKLNGIVWRKKLNISIKDFVFVFAGKIEKKKNPELLINAFQKIMNNHIHLVITGNGNLEDDLKTKYRNLQNLHFVDFQNQSEIPGIYFLGNVFVLPSQGPGETWGLGVNEAMACGKAILVSDKVGCAIDLVENGTNGYIFKSNDLEDLCIKMEILVNNETRTQQMGNYSLNKIKDWNYNAVAEILESVVSFEK